jgi:hypothetical protein
MSRKHIIAILAGLGVAGLVAASAATLGNVVSDNLGAGTGDVASCTVEGVNTSYNIDYDEDVPGGIVTGVQVELDDHADDAACANQALTVTLAGAAGTPELGTATSTMGALGIGTVAFPAAGDPLAVDAAAVFSISVVIDGPGI